MITHVYCMHDAAIGFLHPVVDQNDAMAMRHFQAACQDSPEMKIKPEDFTLYCIGSFDSETGVITGSPAELICSATDFVRKKVK